MATAKITLSASRDIPFNRLVLSQSNVRRVKAGVSIEELAEDIARRSLLQGLSVRPVLDADGQERPACSRSRQGAVGSGHSSFW
jgi:ParB family transcriptional regulator, chromosome partitioning protein